MSEAYLITGATGFLGRFLARVLLRRRQNTQLMLLVRAPDEDTAYSRCHSLIEGTDLAETDALSRITPIRGDLTQPGLGISPAEYGNLIQSIDGVFHCAASVQFNMGRLEAERINLAGTSQVLKLVTQAYELRKSVKLHYVSTTFVAGRQTGCFYEADAPETRRVFNEYERSKALAEQLLRRAKQQVPIIIYRPSQILGDSRTGEIANLDLPYSFLRFGLLGNQWVIPRGNGVTLDMVTVDYVAEAIEYLSRQPEAVGNTFHLVAGPDLAVPIEEFIEIMYQAFNRIRKQKGFGPMPTPKWIAPIHFRMLSWLSLLSKKTRSFASVAKPLLAYLTLRRAYDDREARKILHPAGIQPPVFQECVPNLIQPFVSMLERRQGGKGAGKKVRNRDAPVS